MSIKTKTAFITGANKGIGFETAKQLAQHNYHVYLGCRDIARGSEAISTLSNLSLPNVELIVIDVADEDSIREAFKRISKKTEWLDVLINNAGIRGPVPQPATAVTMKDVRSVFETNFFGAIAVTQLFLPLLSKSLAPRIVNVTSDLSSLTSHVNPDWQYYKFKPAAYAPSKAALNAYTVMLAKELIDSPFKINVVNPGHTATDFNNHQGHKTVTEAAQLLVQYAMLDNDGPTGKFFSDNGETSW